MPCGTKVLSMKKLYSNGAQNTCAPHLVMRRIVLDCEGFIVTNDKHYNILKRTPWPDIKVTNIKEFIELI